MIKPKILYRKLDNLLTQIGEKEFSKGFLFLILAELEKAFAKDLNIQRAFIYEENGDSFDLMDAPAARPPGKIVKSLPQESEGVQRVLRFGSCIFDRPKQLNLGFGANDARTLAAFSITSARGSWMFVFELHNGRDRDEITFFLNAVRAALNQRLFLEGLRNEYEQAVQIQQSLIPKTPPRIKEYQISARSQPARIVGGDFYDFFPFDDGNCGVIIGDASGHGLPAALLVRDVVTGLRVGLSREMKMVHTLKVLNQVIQRNTISTRFVSLFYGEIEAQGNVVFANAGHPAPLMVNRNKVQELQPTGTILGALPDINLHRAYAHIEPDGVLALYSDGIIERKNGKGDSFGLKRLKNIIKKNREKTAAEILNDIFEEASEFGEDTKWKDDATVVVIKRIVV